MASIVDAFLNLFVSVDSDPCRQLFLQQVHTQSNFYVQCNLPYQYKKVTGRRQVSFSKFDEFLTDAEHLSEQSTETLGNWTQAHIYKHLAMRLDTSIDGTSFLFPTSVRWLISLFIIKKEVPQSDHSGNTFPNYILFYSYPE
ncbi:hypothetical protein CA13_39340 [Planctomycetes bacterium CA13]|uniref:Uncharacterized protein n=1 Tax=Novipirellula herctigrandis TaxID=2527986 RepID=A0A5C5Z6N3_9BACT|nr:hypothetical protein CA13_39340 [Planctomycetes bacterium CA13]